MSKLFMPWLLLGILAAVAHQWHLRLDAMPRAPNTRLHETLPSADALRLMSLGRHEVVADYYWLRAISHFGDGKMHKALYPNLAALLQRVVALDPYFASAYIFAGSALTLNGMDFHIPQALLEEGMRRRPDQWRIAFQFGFNSYYFLGDYHRAARALAAAAKLAETPPFVAALATRLAAEAGDPEVGLQLITGMLQNVTDAKLVEMYSARRQLLLLEVALRDTQRAADAYKARHNAPPTRLTELVDDNLLPGIPTDPLGGTLWLNPQGQVQTTHENQRLHLGRQGGAQAHVNADD